ncbi:hypothetical protein LNTAR_03714 [Lentisphaera araneosa HTCC2155]|jgi:hypothetical protein|uniref:PLD phosphodiesterase domain-containing protein n=1 Tax=Lentisphaera araneosa HTCC2155 TaxID=313628 RepID=A6DTM4_9BACT|nr:phospholipase D family protein [Lentisphaera araneosa]EDM25004.1 hypothetical protein LNTAR_03714 [Lentisphaera araneosa HTCC2155]
MAQFLNHDDLSFHFHRLMTQAQKKLILVTPVLKFNKKFKQLLEIKNNSAAKIKVIYGISRLSNDEMKFLKNLEFVHNSVCNDLHASIFLNEHKCIIGGLNLHEFYTPEKGALGVLLNAKQDADAYQNAYQHALELTKISSTVTIAFARTFS